MARKVNCYIGLGSNMGKRAANIQQALAYLSELVGKITANGFVYASEPWGSFDGITYPYLNTAVLLETRLSAEEVLAYLKKIETMMGRKRSIKNAPRVIDLDILFYGQYIIESEDLIVPHPHIADRRFVLQPLQDIDPFFIHPSLGLTIQELLAVCNDPQQELQRV